jgi:putative oxidoreductase
MQLQTERFAPHAYAILRIVTGVMFMMHGTQKLFAWPGTKPRATAALQLTAGVIETVGGVMIALGLFASIAAFVASGTMAVAYFLRHAGTGEKFYPIVNKGELAVLYCFVFLFIASAGSGRWSLDALRDRGTSAGATHTAPLLGRFNPQSFAVLRIVAGLLFAMHGTQKLFGWPGDTPPIDVPMMRIAGTIELVAGLLIAIGLAASFAAFIASGLMAAAYFMKHAPQSFLPILNAGELAVLFCFLWLYIAAAGAGRWSVDAMRNRGGVPRPM